MVAPHFHTTQEAKDAIRKIEHNSGEGVSNAPTEIGGGSGGVHTTLTEKVTNKGKGDDWVSKRGI